MLGWARTVLLSLAMSGSLPAPPGQFFSCHLVAVVAVVVDVVTDVVDVAVDVVVVVVDVVVFLLLVPVSPGQFPPVILL